MKNFTHLITCVLTGLLFCALNANATVKIASDMYGDYKFTTDIEYTTAGAKYNGLIATECDAKIATSEYFKMGITGILGSEYEMGVSAFDATGSLLINEMNPMSYILPAHKLSLADEQGMYMNVECNLVFDPETGIVTFPTLTLVEPQNWLEGEAGVIVAYVTNAKLTPVAQEEQPKNDLSGQWVFVVNPENSDFGTMAGSELPATFTVDITSTNALNTEYSLNLSIEGIGDLTLDATYDGIMLTATSSYAVFSDNSHYLTDINNPSSTDIMIVFSPMNDKTMDMKNGFFVCSSGAMKQYFFDGTIVKGGYVASHNFAGTYRVKTGENSYIGITDVEGYPGANEEFTFTVEKRSSEVETRTFVITWMGKDAWTASQGMSECVVEGNKMTIKTGVCYHITKGGMTQQIEVLSDGGGETESGIVVTYNEDDDTYSIDNFGVLRVTRTYTDYINYTDEPNLMGSNFYYYNTIERVPQEDAVASPKAAEGNAVLYDLNGRRVSRPQHGLYIINGKKVAM